MNPTEVPAEERREKAVRLACGVLLANEVKRLPPDPFLLAEQMGFKVAVHFIRRRQVESLTFPFPKNPMP